MKPRLLDLFCGAGGAAMGYHRAGFEVVGVDINPQPHYPFEFHQADVMEIWAPQSPRGQAVGEWAVFGARRFDAIHASPPCQHYSDLAGRNANADAHPDLVNAVRDLLVSTGLPWVIENVEGAPLRNPVRLCGAMVIFPELRVIRHRLFEGSFLNHYMTPVHYQHPICYTMDKRKRNYGKGSPWRDYVHVNGGGNAPVAAKLAAMGIDWMTGAEVNEAIPPAYTEWIGHQLLAALRTTKEGE